MNERIKAAFERVAAIEERRQGHVVESSLEEKIAAAPDLLEVCKKVLKHRSTYYSNEADYQAAKDEIFSMMMAALAKAEGKEAIK